MNHKYNIFNSGHIENDINSNLLIRDLRLFYDDNEI